MYFPLPRHDCRISVKIAKNKNGKKWYLLTHREWRVTLMSYYSTWVITSIFMANWGYGQGVAAGWVWVSQRLWVPVPDVGGVVTQTAVGVTGQCHLITLWHCFWTHCYSKIWEQKKCSMIAMLQRAYICGKHISKCLLHSVSMNRNLYKWSAFKY